MSMIPWFGRREERGRTNDLGLEVLVEQKLGRFFDQMGDLEAASVHRAVIAQVEKPLIRKCLEWSGGNKLKAARVLGINRNTLSKKVKEYGL